MKKSLKLLSTLTILLGFINGTQSADSSNPFDQKDEPEMLQISESLELHSRRKEVRDTMLSAILSTIISSENEYMVTLENFKPYTEKDAIPILLGAYFLKVKKTAVNAETKKLFNLCRNLIKHLCKHNIITRDEMIVAYGVMPDATPKNLSKVGDIIASIADQAGNPFGQECFADLICRLYHKSAKHSDASFYHVLIMAEKIDSHGRLYSMSAIQLILEQMNKRMNRLTDIAKECGYQLLVNIALYERGLMPQILETIKKANPQIHKIVNGRIKRFIGS